MTLNTSSSRILRGWWEVLTKTIKEFCPLILWVHQQKNFESQHLSRRRRKCSLKQNFSRRSAIDPLHSKIMMLFLNTVLYTSLGILTMRIFSKNQELIGCAIVYFHDHKVWFNCDAARGVGCPSLSGVKGSGYFLADSTDTWVFWIQIVIWDINLFSLFFVSLYEEPM